jgi:hypothetical protein
MKELFSVIAAKAGKHLWFISIPYWLVGLGIKAIELLHLPFPVSSENLNGLRQLQSYDNTSDLQALGIVPLELKETIDLL